MIIHGESTGNGTRLYTIWEGMFNRVYNPTHKNYKDYGGRGIVVCDEWKVAKNFLDWAHANGYADNLEIDREDNDGNYCPENCRWVTHLQNCTNKRNRPDFGIFKIPSGYRIQIKRNYISISGGVAKDLETARILRDILVNKLDNIYKK
jgi:hypothetical protein